MATNPELNPEVILGLFSPFVPLIAREQLCRDC